MPDMEILFQIVPVVYYTIEIACVVRILHLNHSFNIGIEIVYAYVTATILHLHLYARSKVWPYTTMWINN